MCRNYLDGAGSTDGWAHAVGSEAAGTCLVHKASGTPQQYASQQAGAAQRGRLLPMWAISMLSFITNHGLCEASMRVPMKAQGHLPHAIGLSALYCCNMLQQQPWANWQLAHAGWMLADIQLTHQPVLSWHACHAVINSLLCRKMPIAHVAYFAGTCLLHMSSLCPSPSVLTLVPARTQQSTCHNRQVHQAVAAPQQAASQAVTAAPQAPQGTACQLH